MAYSTISKPSLYFNTKLYTGNGATQAITGVGFQPDFIWAKDRDTSRHHYLADVIRGVKGRLRSDATNAEYTAGANDGFDSFDSDGFTLEADSSSLGLNENGSSQVSWNWKAGTAVSGNTTGSGTYKTYTGSVNTTAGFSIIKYVGNGTVGHQIPHRLGVAPNMIIIKHMSASENWFVYHSSLGNNKDLLLNLTNDASNTVTTWNSTSPTSTVWSMSNQSAINDNNDEFIAYCFAEKRGYSKFGKYTGNGSTDGTFVYTGFKPSLIILKDIDNAGENWFIFDNKRPGYNLNANHLNPNSSTTETNSSANTIDIVSHGFKARSTNNGTNRSGANFIYMAIAEEPLVANVGASIPATAR